MKNSQVQEFGSFDLPGESSSHSTDNTSDKNTLSDLVCDSFTSLHTEKLSSSSYSYNLTANIKSISDNLHGTEKSTFHCTVESNCINVCESSCPTVQKTCVSNTENILSVEYSSAVTVNPPSLNSTLNNASFCEKDFKSSLKDYSLTEFNSVNKFESLTGISKNQSSRFQCPKCGLGFPCTNFLCKRVSYTDNYLLKQSNSDNISERSSSSNNDFLPGSLLFEGENSCILNSLKDTASLEYQKACRTSTSKKNTDLVASLLLKEKEENCSEKKNSHNKDKMQCKNASNEVINIDLKLGKSGSNNSADPWSSKMPVGSISRGAKSFLDELAASAANKTCNDSNVSGYALSATSSHFSSIKSKKMSEANSDDNLMEGSILNEEDNAVSIPADPKEVTNALELIEQSSLQDRDLSSAEICNSLNQIFTDTNPSDTTANAVSNVENNQTEEISTANAVSNVENNQTEEISTANAVSNVENNQTEEISTANAVSNVENNETEEISTEYETITVNLNNSEFLLQGSESNIALSTDAEGGTINLADLCSGNNSELWQSVVLIQDESGNISTVLVLPEDAQIIEGGSSALNEGNVQIVLSENYMDNVETNECLDNTLTDNSAIEQDAPNCVENVFLTQDLTGDEVNKPETENSSLLANTFVQNNLKVNDNLLTIKNLPEETQIKLAECSSNKAEVIPKLENNLIVKPANEIESDKEKYLFSGQSLNNLENNQESPSKNSSQFVDNGSINKGLYDNTESNQINNSALANLIKNPEIYVSTAIVSNHVMSKAKKRCSQGLSENDKSFDLIECSVVNPSSKIFPATPVNGAVYRSIYESQNSSNSEQLKESELFLNKSLQKSKKSFPQKLPSRSAKKSFLRTDSSLNFSENSVLEAYKLLSNSRHSGLSEIMKNVDEYVELKNLILKRKTECDDLTQGINKRTKSFLIDNSFDNNFNTVLKSKINTIALKTFKKPFTAAKKSVFDSRENVRNFRNTALKTFVPKSKLNSAMKSFSRSLPPKKVANAAYLSQRALHESDVTAAKRHLSNQVSRKSFQPGICEIRTLPNDYVQRASRLLLKASSVEPASTPEENVSEEEAKLQTVCSSPLKEIMLSKPQCSCTAKEVPCLCNEGNLQLTCEAEDSFDDKIIPCTNHVSQQYLLTPSSEIKHRAFCDVHMWRLRQHHCCPTCGVFCSQGEFLLCSNDELEVEQNHLFHPSCFIVPFAGLPPSCPHCCKFSNFNAVNLIHIATDESSGKEVPLNAQNITSELHSCSIFLTVKENLTANPKIETKGFVPEKSEVQLMIGSLAKEKTLRLRPTGKCLYNPIKTGDIQKVMLLIGNGVNPNHKFRMHGNNSPLHVAAQYGWTGTLHILLQAGAFIDSVNDDLETPLIVAVEKKQLPIVRYLVHAGSQIDVKDCNGMTSFHIASKNGFKEIAEFLYSTGRIDINLQDDGGWTALVWACEHKHVGFVKWLLTVGADPNVRDNEENTVLHWAAYSGICEIAELLLERGCTLSYVNKRGDSALHIAAREDNYECVKLFINRGAVVDQKNRENKTPLMCCEEDSMSFNYLLSISSGALKIGKMQLEKHVVFRDISRGAEAYPIPAINEIDDEEFIMEFRYVVKQCHKSGIDIDNTVGNMQFCFCKSNCNTRDCNCITNANCWYDASGCLTIEYDLHSMPAIFECNKTCHCPKTCINRVVQRGLKFPLQIFRTRYQGWGVKTLQEIPKGAFVCEYAGELITGTESEQRDDDTYFFGLDSQGADYCLDGRYYGNVARFLNHSCEPNLIALKVFVDHQDLNFPRIAFFALRDIHGFEELCFDYGLDFWIVKSQTVLCTCQTESCRYSKDSIDDTLWKYFRDTKNNEQSYSGC